jgi:hypothetical protein
MLLKQLRLVMAVISTKGLKVAIWRAHTNFSRVQFSAREMGNSMHGQ